ncbi:MAG: phosphonate metabolism protein/1,5-bisphosphokinase (PRPP-forming) PhnN [Rhizobiales bacterium PAR1]|nr:MAG: phosphonate metabolism protein/1,5-bisphosphokinase (PRPP-forming) PhnN [Rhizobiales bacterium PAR1]
MSAATPRTAPDPAPCPAPGTFVAVIGASGAGKDTILAGARAALAGEPAFLFPRRLITRPADQHEDNEAISPDAFDVQARSGAFLLYWNANRHSYALPASLERDLENGRHIVTNVSRTVVEEIRHRFLKSLVVEIRVDPIVLIERLARRGRESADAQAERFRRSASLAAMPTADLVIDNTGEAEVALAHFIKVLERLRGGSRPD